MKVNTFFLIVSLLICGGYGSTFGMNSGVNHITVDDLNNPDLYFNLEGYQSRKYKLIYSLFSSVACIFDLQTNKSIYDVKCGVLGPTKHWFVPGDNFFILVDLDGTIAIHNLEKREIVAGCKVDSMISAAFFCKASKKIIFCSSFGRPVEYTSPKDLVVSMKPFLDQRELKQKKEISMKKKLLEAKSREQFYDIAIAVDRKIVGMKRKRSVGRSERKKRKPGQE